MIRVVLVDDHPVVRTGLKAMLDSTGRYEVVAEASSGEEGVDKTRRLDPDVVIMDLTMPGIGGVEATRRIAALKLKTKILVLTIHKDDDMVLAAAGAGAHSFLNKDAADTGLVGALEALMRGHSYLPGRVSELLARKGRRVLETGPGVDILSSRERTAVALYADGCSAREMADEMGVRPKTVEGYIANAKRKLHLKTRHELVRFAVEAGLFRP